MAVYEDVANPYYAGAIRNVVEIAVWVGVGLVNGWRDRLVADLEASSNCLERAGYRERLPNHRFYRGYWDLVSMVSKAKLESVRIADVEVGKRASMGIDVVNFARGDSSILEGSLEGRSHDSAGEVALSHANCFSAGGRSQEFGIDARSARLRKPEFLQNDGGPTLRDHQSVAKTIIGARGCPRIADSGAERSKSAEGSERDREDRCFATSSDNNASAARVDQGGRGSESVEPRAAV
jgi:hypothetical protein